MKARTKTGHIISGRIAEIFVSNGIAYEIEDDAVADVDDDVDSQVVKQKRAYNKKQK
jgi:hypothetical protein